MVHTPLWHYAVMKGVISIILSLRREAGRVWWDGQKEGHCQGRKHDGQMVHIPWGLCAGMAAGREKAQVRPLTGRFCWRGFWPGPRSRRLGWWIQVTVGANQ